MSEKKKWTLEELKQLDVTHNMQKDMIYDKKEVSWVAIRKESSDGMGSYLIKLFEKVNNDHFEEVNVLKEANRMAKLLGKSITKEMIIREVLVELEGDRFCELIKRLEKKPKVTTGIRRGSCVFMYVQGRQGRKQKLQITH